MKVPARFLIGLSVGLAVGYGAGIYTGVHARKPVTVAQVEPSDSPGARKLAALRAQLSEMQLQYRESYPLVQDVKRRIQALEKQQSAK